jgi:hypothetical protein
VSGPLDLESAESWFASCGKNTITYQWASALIAEVKRLRAAQADSVLRSGK